MAKVTPTALGWELLQEYENDPTGLGFLDIEKLLEEWAVISTLPGQDLVGYRSRSHPSLPGLHFYYPTLAELAPPIVLGICRALRELYRRTST